jgi:hypothetical protein
MICPRSARHARALPVTVHLDGIRPIGGKVVPGDGKIAMWLPKGLAAGLGMVQTAGGKRLDGGCYGVVLSVRTCAELVLQYVVLNRGPGYPPGAGLTCMHAG